MPFQCYKCYDLIPTSAKLVILDTELILKQVMSSYLIAQPDDLFDMDIWISINVQCAMC